jgi:hypothetical protein
MIQKCEAWAEKVVAHYAAGNDREACLPWSRDKFDLEFLRQWLASRKVAGRAIDIETCELGRWKSNDCDPYGIREILGELPEEAYQIGTNRFVRSSKSHGWICEDDLPPEKVTAMYERIKCEHAAWMKSQAH